MTPTARSLARMRKAGYLAGVTERWVSQARKRVDLFGFIDVLAVKPPLSRGYKWAVGGDTLAIQATTGANAAARVTKIKALPEARTWLECGHRIEVHGWRLLKGTGRWECRVVEVRLEDVATQNQP